MAVSNSPVKKETKVGFYLRDFNLSGALSEKKRLEENTARLAEYEARKAEQKAEVKTELPTSATPADGIYIPNIDVTVTKASVLIPEETKTIKVVFYDTSEAFRREMKELTIKHGIKYGGIN